MATKDGYSLDEESTGCSRKAIGKASQCVGKLANEPTIGLYHVQQHTRSTIRSYIPIKNELRQINTKTDDALFDVDYSIMTMKEWHSLETFMRIERKMSQTMSILEDLNKKYPEKKRTRFMRAVGLRVSDPSSMTKEDPP
mmetsp:Transcript_43693/g.61401  ORF Transcript_43693/g.61401 Transcript_43693/m.61401 type:complete len:140 (-) Transcript_43693:63-482(-)